MAEADDTDTRHQETPLELFYGGLSDMAHALDELANSASGEARYLAAEAAATAWVIAQASLLKLESAATSIPENIELARVALTKALIAVLAQIRRAMDPAQDADTAQYLTDIITHLTNSSKERYLH